MKTKSTLLLILAAFAALPVAGHAQLDPDTGTLGFIINAPLPPLEHPIHPGAPQPVLVPNHPSAPALPPVHRAAQAPAAAAPVNVSAAAQFLAGVLADGKTVRLSDLFLNPEFFAAAHAAGPEADALRGQIDWLMLSGVILGFDGMDGSDDIFGGGGDDEVSPQATAPASNGIILGGPGSDTIILGGPGSDTLAPYIQPSTIQPPVPGIILGGPGSDTIILGGPGSDTLAPKPTNGFVFGTNSSLK
jgi:hypothetical protein